MGAAFSVNSVAIASSLWASISITSKILGQKIEDGKIILNPLLIKYLERHGVIDVQDDISEN